MKEIEAKEIVQRSVMDKLEGFSLMEECTEEYSSCFAFYYQNDEYLKSREESYMSIGAGPVLVCKKTSRVFETGAAYSTNHYVKKLESCGSPFGELTTTICVHGWEEGKNKASAIKLIKRVSGLTMSESKSIIDKVLKGNSCNFSTSSIEISKEALIQLKVLGFKCKRVWDNQV